MKLILCGTRHDKNEDEIDVILKYEDDDTWTFEIGKINFTVSNLSVAMDFLKEEFQKI